MLLCIVDTCTLILGESWRISLDTRQNIQFRIKWNRSRSIERLVPHGEISSAFSYPELLPLLRIRVVPAGFYRFNCAQTRGKVYLDGKRLRSNYCGIFCSFRKYCDNSSRDLRLAECDTYVRTAYRNNHFMQITFRHCTDQMQLGRENARATSTSASTFVEPSFVEPETRYS